SSLPDVRRPDPPQAESLHGLLPVDSLQGRSRDKPFLRLHPVPFRRPRDEQPRIQRLAARDPSGLQRVGSPVADVVRPLEFHLPLPEPLRLLILGYALL